MAYAFPDVATDRISTNILYAKDALGYVHEMFLR